MAFIRCDSCGWSQYDFWDPYYYNPAKYLASWNAELFGDKLDEPYTNDPEFLAEYGAITLRELIAREYERCAKNIRKQHWIREADFTAAKAQGKAVCPRCGTTNY